MLINFLPSLRNSELLIVIVLLTKKLFFDDFLIFIFKGHHTRNIAITCILHPNCGEASSIFL